MISISGLKKKRVLASLYNDARVQGMGHLHADGRIMSDDEADKILIENEPILYFDYLKGRVMKVNLSGDEFDPSLYDRDNGEGAASLAIGKVVRP